MTARDHLRVDFQLQHTPFDPPNILARRVELLATLVIIFVVDLSSFHLILAKPLLRDYVLVYIRFVAPTSVLLPNDIFEGRLFPLVSVCPEMESWFLLFPDPYWVDNHLIRDWKISVVCAVVSRTLYLFLIVSRNHANQCSPCELFHVLTWLQ